VRALLVALALLVAGCSSLHVVRVQPETVDVGPGLRPIAAIQASVSSFYLLFIPIPGGVNLDRVVNRMLIVTAKTMGADKIAQLRFHIDSCIGFWCFWKILGQQDAWASGIAVQVIAPPPDPTADEGPEPGR
jgi:hypothetical protein